MSLSSKLPREVVFERELDLETVAVEPVREVLAAPPLELAADHRVRHRVVEQVAECILSILEGIRRLRIGVVVVLARVADRAAELLVPRVIDERDNADDWDRF